MGKLPKVPPGKELSKIIRKACSDGYQYLSCRIVSGEMSKVQLLEAHGFYTVDIGTTWARKTEKITDHFSQVKIVRISDAPALTAMSAGLFRNSRFYNDPFFSSKEADKIYHAWILNALHDQTCRTFWVEGCGFITCKKNKNSGNIALIGVVPEKQGKGIGRSLVHYALSWLKRSNVDTIAVRTQTNNIGAINFYTRLGFRIKSADVTMGLILEVKQVSKKHATGI